MGARRPAAGRAVVRRLEADAVEHARRVLGEQTTHLLGHRLAGRWIPPEAYLPAARFAQTVLEVYVDRIRAVEAGVVAASTRLNGARR